MEDISKFNPSSKMLSQSNKKIVDESKISKTFQDPGPLMSRIETGNWKVWRIWSKDLSKRLEDLPRPGAPKSAGLEEFCLSLFEELDESSDNFPVELFQKNYQMFSMDPHSDRNFWFKRGQSELHVLGSRLVPLSEQDVVGEEVDIACYDELAQTLDRTLTSPEVWIVNGGNVVRRPTGFGTSPRKVGRLSLNLNNGQNKTINIMRIYLDQDETDLDFLMEETALFNDSAYTFAYTAEGNGRKIFLRRTREPTVLGHYRTPLDRVMFPIIGKVAPKMGHELMLKTNWNADPHWLDGKESVKARKSSTTMFDCSSPNHFTSPVFTSKLSRDHRINEKLARNKTKNGALRTRWWMLMAFVIAGVMVFWYACKYSLISSGEQKQVAPNITFGNLYGWMQSLVCTTDNFDPDDV